MTELMRGTIPNVSKMVEDDLCPLGTWQLTEAVRKLLRLHLSRLPRQVTSEQEARYPTGPAGMRAFLDTFFARHYFQVQNSLLGYLASGDFLDSLWESQVAILDIGAGPALASIATTDMIACSLKYMVQCTNRQLQSDINFSYVLNNTSNICLSTGRQMLRDYWQLAQSYDSRIIGGKVLPIQTSFPDNMFQLRRICRNTGPYNIIILSYILNPLSEQHNLDAVCENIAKLQDMLRPSGRMLILQDRFSAPLVKKVGRKLRADFDEQTVTQHIYSHQNENETYTYTYYSCLLESTRRNISHVMNSR